MRLFLMHSRVAHVVVAVALAGVFAHASPARAIEGWNVSLLGGHHWETLQDEEETAGNSSSFLPKTQAFDGNIGGAFTVPLIHGLGTRVIVLGNLGSTERDAASGFAGADFDRDGVDTTAMLFVRDPGFGHFDVGYRFRWEEPSEGTLERETSHGAVVEAGLYVPDQGMGFVDWDIALSYARTEAKFDSGTDAIDEYGAVAEIAYYAGDSLRLSGGASWQIAVPDNQDETDDLRGVGTISWLMPFAIDGNRFATLDLEGSYGRVRTKLGGPFSDAEQRAWSAGVNLRFDYPGARTMLELIRERR